MSVSTTSLSPWHDGERRMQDTIGVRDRMEEMGKRVIRDYMPDQHREFFGLLPFLVVGTVDDAGDAWATQLVGPPGFMNSPDPKTLTIAAEFSPGDPARVGPGAPVGLLGVQPHSRRRNRMNGRLKAQDAGLAVTVEHSFGNCPQYIQTRNFEFAEETADAPVISTDLTPAARAMIAAADTFYVASYVDTGKGRQVDVSHRGGKVGFVRIGDDGLLTIPDFAGNLHFNTLGNFLLNPRAGLLFVDHETGDVLQMTGEAAVILDSPEIAAFQGAERLWTFRPAKVVLRRKASPLRWRFLEWSPNSLMTGSWEEAAARLAAEAKRLQWRPLRVARIIDESDVIRSFHFEPADDAGLSVFEAGQHLPIRLNIPGEDKPTLRTYTLSQAPSDPGYRISVKREGKASSFLHDQVRVGDIVEARSPQGTFTVDAAERRPLVLLAGGVGVTPMLAMLRHVVYEGLRTRRVRPTWFIQSARTVASRAFAGEVAELVAAAGGKVTALSVIAQPESEKLAGVDFDVAGRIDMDLLKRTLPFDDFDFYLCGPPGFMQAIYDGLRTLRVPDDRIFAESFGPASLTRTPDGPTLAPGPKPATSPVPVAFMKSAKEARWAPGGGFLLDLAEERGLAPEYSCRSGSCGTCRTKILEGKVAYASPPSATVAADEALICCAMPAGTEDGGGDRLVLDL